MQRTWLLMAWLLMLSTPPDGAIASAQAMSTPTPAASRTDTLNLSLRDALRLAREQNPTLLAEYEEIGIAWGTLRQARVVGANPSLEVRAPGAGSDGRVGEYEITLRQEVALSGQRTLRVRAATAGLERARALTENAARTTLLSVSRAFYSALAAQQRLAVVTELSNLGQELLRTTRTQAREGEISVMDANLAEIEAGRARARQLAAEREALIADFELQQQVGLSPTIRVRAVNEATDPAMPMALSVDSLVAVAMQRRPDLQAEGLSVRYFDALSRLAAREAIPNPTVGGFLARQEDANALPATRYGPSRIGLEISLPIPLFQRNRGTVDEQRARTRQAQLRQEAAELAVRTEVAAAVRAYQSAVNEAQIFEHDVLTPARTSQKLLDTAFQAGKVALPTLLLLRNQLLDAELGSVDAWLAARQAWIGLQAATATFDLISAPRPREESR